VVALIALVTAVGLIDSANPSTIGPALYLATGSAARRQLAAFTGGVFVVQVAAGLILILGPGQAILAAAPHPGRRATHLIELFLGGAMVIFATVLWAAREGVARRFAREQRRVRRSSLALGAGIMVIELPTALPYFAVIAAIVGSGRRIPTQIALVVLFNLAFIIPLLAIFALRSLGRQGSERRLTRLRTELDRFAPLLIPFLILLVGAALLTLGSIGSG